MIIFLLILGFAFTESVPQEELKPDISKTKSLKLSCPVKKEEFVLWYKEDEKTRKDIELQFSDRYFFSSLTDVVINGPTLEDAGTYKCKEPFSPGVIKIFLVKPFDSSVLKPEKNIEAPKWVLIPNVVKVLDSSQPAILPCRATGKNVVTKAFRLKFSGEVMHELSQSGVVLHRPKEEDSGKYLCTAENEGGKLSHTFEISVRVNGGVSQWSEWGQCDEECGYGVQTRTRKCDNPRPANGGRRCTNSMTERQRCRERSCSTPRLAKFGFDLTDEKTLKLYCHPKGLPTPSVQWKFDGRPLDSTYDYRNPTMIIPKSHARSGSYSCTIRNRVGYFTMYITIDV